MVTYLASGYTNLAKYPVPAMKRRDWEVFVVLEGEISLQVAGAKPHGYERSFIWVMPPGLEYGWRSRTDTVKRYAMHFTSVPTALQKEVEARGFLGRRIERDEHRKIVDLYHVLDRYSLDCDSLDTLHVKRAELDLAFLVLKGIASRITMPVKPANEQRIEDALNWYHAHLDESPGVDDVSAAIGISPGHLRRIFKANRGCSPKVALVEIRIQQAKILLGETTENLSDIVTRCGFSHFSDFCRVFKKYTGISPHRWRTRLNARASKSGYGLI